MTNDNGILITNIYYMLTYAFQVLRRYDYDTVAGVYRLYVKEYDETDGRFSFTLAR